MALREGNESTCLHIHLQEREKLETRDHYIPNKLQISGLPATSLANH